MVYSKAFPSKFGSFEILSKRQKTMVYSKDFKYIIMCVHMHVQGSSPSPFSLHTSRALHNMRNYIHINLCISLGIAQLIFVAGVNQSASDHVPIHCQVIAVLIHYFFLVSFMWMLMEGVVLYVALVRVFVERKKLYLFGFTIISYGVPLLYLGLLALPLGFALPTQPNYGYDKA